MITENQIRESLTIIQRAMAEAPEVLERIALEIDGNAEARARAALNRISVSGVIGGPLSKENQEFAALIVKQFRDGDHQAEADHRALAADIVKAYNDASPTARW